MQSQSLKISILTWMAVSLLEDFSECKVDTPEAQQSLVAGAFCY